MSRRKFDIRYDWRDGPVKEIKIGDELSEGLVVEDVGEEYYILKNISDGDLDYYSKQGKCLSDDKKDLDLDNKGIVDINSPWEFNEFLKSVQKYYGPENPVILTIEESISHFHHTIWLFKPELMIEQLLSPRNKNIISYRFFGEIIGEKIHYGEHNLPDNQQVTCEPTAKFGMSRQVKFYSEIRADIIIECGSPM